MSFCIPRFLFTPKERIYREKVISLSFQRNIKFYLFRYEFLVGKKGFLRSNGVEIKKRVLICVCTFIQSGFESDSTPLLVTIYAFQLSQIKSKCFGKRKFTNRSKKQARRAFPGFIFLTNFWPVSGLTAL